MAKNMYSSPYDDLPAEASAAIGRIDISIPGYDEPFVADVRKDLKIDDENIEAQLRSCVERAAFYGHILALVRAETSLVERRIKFMRARVRLQGMEKAKEDGLRPTDKFLDAFEETNEEIQMLEAKHIMAWRDNNRMWALSKNMDQRIDVLRTLAGFRKQEMKRYLDS